MKQNHRKGVYYFMEYLRGKHFSITDQKDINTVVYEINKTDKNKSSKFPKFTIERLDSIEELVDDKKRKTFFVDLPKKAGNQLLFLTFQKDQVTVNMGLLKHNEVKFIKKNIPMKFDTISSDSTEESYKEFNCTPNMRMPIYIIDPETGNEINPILYYDNKTNEVKGKCILKPNKSYLAFRIR